MKFGSHRQKRRENMDRNIRKIILEIFTDMLSCLAEKSHYQVRSGHRQPLMIRSLYEQPVPSRCLYIQSVADEILHKTQAGPASDKSEGGFP